MIVLVCVVGQLGELLEQHEEQDILLAVAVLDVGDDVLEAGVLVREHRRQLLNHHLQPLVLLLYNLQR